MAAHGGGRGVCAGSYERGQGLGELHVHAMSSSGSETRAEGGTGGWTTLGREGDGWQPVLGGRVRRKGKGAGLALGAGKRELVGWLL